VTDKLYAGAKGVTVDILSADVVCVYVTGLNEIMTFPPSSLRPVKPIVNSKVKVGRPLIVFIFFFIAVLSN
jgi:hypothetical protein